MNINLRGSDFLSDIDIIQKELDTKKTILKSHIIEIEKIDIKSKKKFDKENVCFVNEVVDKYSNPLHTKELLLQTLGSLKSIYETKENSIVNFLMIFLIFASFLLSFISLNSFYQSI